MLFHEDHTLQFGLTITHNKGQKFDLILQIRQPQSGRGGAFFKQLRKPQLLGRRISAAHVLQTSICPNTTLSRSLPSAQGSALSTQAGSTDTEGSRGQRAAAPPVVLHKPALTPQER